ncbi:unnamed protein product [Blepharisma stoltei]|uniref:RING-type domain-containing protein n=1 Tax=Blepharisma stoltei TaxID=1481888 RepID=A0AAU9JIV7_9CILI|nr:unnamed protein product [Blepharisma stoltei]
MPTTTNSHPLDWKFLNPSKGLKYLYYQFTISFITSICISTISFKYLYSNFGNSFLCDKYLTYWLVLFSLVKFCDIPLKVKLLLKLVYLSSRIKVDDTRFTIKRLMNLVRSSIFKTFELLNISSYLLLIYGLVRIVSGNTCDENLANPYSTSVKVMMIFIIRLIIGIIVLKFDDNEPVIRGFPEFLYFLQDGAEIEDIENLQEISMNDDFKNQYKNDVCSVCTFEFQEGDVIKVLPCYESHTFHKDCIDRWLIQKDSCPLCGSSIAKKNK